MERSPRDIRDMVEQGAITPEDGALMFQGMRKQGEIVPAGEASSQGDVVIKIKTFQHTQKAPDNLYYDHRTETARKTRHLTGTAGYAIVGAVDGVIDSIVYGIGELAEDATYLVSRVNTRAREGWYRGKIR